MAGLVSVQWENSARIPDQKTESYKEGLSSLSRGLGLGKFVSQTVGDNTFKVFKYPDFSNLGSTVSVVFSAQRSLSRNLGPCYVSLNGLGYVVSGSGLEPDEGCTPGNSYAAAAIALSTYAALNMEKGCAMPMHNSYPFPLNVSTAIINTFVSDASYPYGCLNPFWMYASLKREGLLDGDEDYRPLNPRRMAGCGRVNYLQSCVEVAGACYGLDEKAILEGIGGIGSLFPKGWNEQRLKDLIANYRKAAKASGIPEEEIVSRCLEGAANQKIGMISKTPNASLYEGSDVQSCLNSMPMFFLNAWCEENGKDFWPIVYEVADRYDPQIQSPSKSVLKEKDYPVYVTSLSFFLNVMLGTSLTYADTMYSFGGENLDNKKIVDYCLNTVFQDVSALCQDLSIELKPFSLFKDASTLEILSRNNDILCWDVYRQLAEDPTSLSSLLIWNLLVYYYHQCINTAEKSNASAAANKKLYMFTQLLDCPELWPFCGISEENAKIIYDSYRGKQENHPNKVSASAQANDIASEGEDHSASADSENAETSGEDSLHDEKANG